MKWLANAAVFIVDQTMNHSTARKSHQRLSNTALRCAPNTFRPMQFSRHTAMLIRLGCTLDSIGHDGILWGLAARRVKGTCFFQRQGCKSYLCSESILAQSRVFDITLYTCFPLHGGLTLQKGYCCNRWNMNVARHLKDFLWQWWMKAVFMDSGDWMG